MDGHRIMPHTSGPRTPALCTPAPEQDDGQPPQQRVQAVAGQRLVADDPVTHTAADNAPKKSIDAQKSCHSADPQPAQDGPDFSDPQLRINFVADSFRPLDQLVQQPRCRPQLKPDALLVWLGSQPGAVAAPDSVEQSSPEDYIRAQLQERQSIEKAGGQFQFRPLMTTLENMQRFIGHIQAGKQFPTALDAAQSAALARLGEQTTALVQAGTPYYKQTVLLSLSLMVLCEIITKKQVLAPLHKEQQALFSRMETTLNADPSREAELVAALPLVPTTKEDAYAFQRLLKGLLHGNVRTDFLGKLNDREALMFPSFETLGLEHFCRFAGLPLYPVGLVTDYLCSADGFLFSPLVFTEHDIEHMLTLRDVGQPCEDAAPEALLCRYKGRQQLCQLLLDQTADCLPGWPLKKPLTLLLFELLHEEPPVATALAMGRSFSPFCFFLQKLTQALRSDRSQYDEPDRQYTDEQAAQAALWAATLWRHCEKSGACLTPERLQHHARTFVEEEAPRLRKHLDFVARHRGTLRQLFMDVWARKDACENDNHSFSIKIEHGSYMALFRSNCGEHNGLRNLDNTDLAYFWALHSPELRQKMKETIQASLP